MNTLCTEEIIAKYSATHLICDCAYPLITDSNLEEEAMLYNLGKQDMVDLMESFIRITGKSVNAASDVSTLSGGQKVVLLILFCLYSPAQHIVIINLSVSLDVDRYHTICTLINQFHLKKTELLIVYSDEMENKRG